MITNNMLINFPKTYAFVAYAAARIKGQTVDFWMETLKDYHIRHKCQCRQCYTFGLIPPDGVGPFGDNEFIRFFGDTIVVLYNNDDGGLVEVELPEITDIPFADEYAVLDTDTYNSIVTNKEAFDLVKQWFKNHTI